MSRWRRANQGCKSHRLSPPTCHFWLGIPPYPKRPWSFQPSWLRAAATLSSRPLAANSCNRIFFRSRQLLPIVNSRQGADNPHHVLYAGFAFSAFAALSSLWSIVPAISLQKGVVLALLSAATFLVMRAALQTDFFTLRQACLGFLVSMAMVRHFSQSNW